MFAIFGICGLLVFILARPQEYVEALQRLPMLYLCAAAAAGGFVLDLKLRRLEPRPVPILWWAVGFMVWAALCNAVAAPNQLTPGLIELAILFVLFATIAHAVQRLRTLRVVAGMVVAVTMVLTVVCIHQGMQDRSCIISDPEHPGEGIPDGRPCEMAAGCYGHDAQPGFEYRCEKAGLFGTYSIEDRVRYRGDLHDPNELGLTVSVFGLALLLGFATQRRRPLAILATVVGGGLVVWCVVLTQSRGAIAVVALIGAVYAVRRLGVAGLVAGAALALPLLALGGRSGARADASTELRYEAWSAGLDMFRHSPVFGVGQRQFAEHHVMTAHNSFVLALAELGFVGLVLFVILLYLSIKTLIRGVIELDAVPGARPAQAWAVALLAAFAGTVLSINTLSFCYHPVLWILLGLGGAWVSAVRHHKPDFHVGITFRDLVIIVGACAAYALVILPVFVRWKGA